MTDNEDITTTFFKGMPKQHVDDIRDILQECDKEFVPPLSLREVPWQTKLGERSEDGSAPQGIESYIDSMRGDNFLVMSASDGEVLAFLSYMPGHVHPEETDGKVVDYVTTICVRHSHRGRGLARRLYEEVERLAESGTMAVRTWSTNGAQMHLLRDMGYSERKRAKDDRGDGIDTVYFEKRL